MVLGQTKRATNSFDIGQKCISDLSPNCWKFLAYFGLKFRGGDCTDYVRHGNSDFAKHSLLKSWIYVEIDENPRA